MVRLMTFSHDGLRDSLTHLAAPPYFYESLRRELISAERDKRKFSLLRLQLSPTSYENQSIKTPLDSMYESAIVDFAELIKISVRGEDICARLGRFEFTLIIKAPLPIAKSIAQRIQSSWGSKHVECLSATLSVNSQESTLEVLNRLDNQELLNRTQSLAN